MSTLYAKGSSSTVPGNLTHEGDNDWFLIDLSNGSDITLTLETTSRSAGLTAAPVIYMYKDEKGLPVGGVPRIAADDSIQTHWPRILRNGAENITNGVSP